MCWKHVDVDVGLKLSCLNESEVLVVLEKYLKYVSESWMVFERHDLTFFVYTSEISIELRTLIYVG